MKLLGYTLSATITILIAVGASPGHGQQQRSATEQAPAAGSARRVGRVVAADNGTPVRRAYVRIYRSTPGPPCPIF